MKLNSDEKYNRLPNTQMSEDSALSTRNSSDNVIFRSTGQCGGKLKNNEKNHPSSVLCVDYDTSGLIIGRTSQTSDIVSYEDLSIIRSNTNEGLELRDYAVRELLLTEETYVNTLNELVDEYEKALPIQNDEKCNIFLDIHAILCLHEGFLQTLRSACVSVPGRTERLAHAFIRWQDRFLIYGDYCVKLQYAQAMLSHLRQTDPSFYKILSMCRRHSSSLSRFRLEDLIVVPFQRVLKYHLLLSNIMRYEDGQTTRSQRKKSILQQAVNAMNDVNNYINEIKRDNDNLKIINDIQTRITDFKNNCADDLVEYGRILYSGLMKVKLHNQELKTRSVFLLEKAILVCRGKGVKLGFKAIICLSQMGLEDPSSMEWTSSREHSYGFSLRDLDLPNICHEFFTSSQIEKSQWVANLAKALINLSSEHLWSYTHRHQFMYTSTDRLGERCSVCNQYLTGLTLQAFRCCLCGDQVHRKCIVAIPICRAGGDLDLFVKQKRYRNRLAINIDLPDLIKSTRPRSSAVITSSSSGSSGLNRVQSMQARTVDSESYNRSSSYGSARDLLKGLGSKWRFEKTNKLPSCKCGNIQKRYSVLSRNSMGVEKENIHINEIWFSNWSRKKAEAVLLRDDVPDNSFLIRPRESAQQSDFTQYSLSLKHDKRVFHIRIHSSSEHFLTESLRFQSLQKLVNYYTVNSLEDNFPPVQSPILYPIHAVYKAFE